MIFPALLVLVSLVGLLANSDRVTRVLSGPIVGALGSSLGFADRVLTAWRFAKRPARRTARSAAWSLLLW